MENFMKMSKRVWMAGAGVVALGLAVPAIASHGKVGLWNVTVTVQMAGMPAMPDMSKLPPEAQAAMRAHGVTMNGHTINTTHCMTAEEVNQDTPPDMSRNKDCRMTNVRMGGQSMSADMVCTGEMQGTGHVDISFDSPEHYSGKSTMTGTLEGRPVNNVTTFDGRWVSADCKGATN
jgi:hypothetical protein